MLKFSEIIYFKLQEVVKENIQYSWFVFENQISKMVNNLIDKHEVAKILQYLESNCLNFEFVYTNDILFHRKLTKLHRFL